MSSIEQRSDKNRAGDRTSLIGPHFFLRSWAQAEARLTAVTPQIWNCPQNTTKCLIKTYLRAVSAAGRPGREHTASQSTGALDEVSTHSQQVIILHDRGKPTACPKTTAISPWPSKQVPGANPTCPDPDPWLMGQFHNNLAHKGNTTRLNRVTAMEWEITRLRFPATLIAPGKSRWTLLLCLIYTTGTCAQTGAACGAVGFFQHCSITGYAISF